MNTENSEIDAVPKEQMEEKPQIQIQPPKSVGNINGFNKDDFLAQLNMNEKISYLLRSPTKTTNGTRQRSVFTAITVSSKNSVKRCPNRWKKPQTVKNICHMNF